MIDDRVYLYAYYVFIFMFVYSLVVYIIGLAISVVSRQEPFIVALRFRAHIETVQMYKRFYESPSPTLSRFYFFSDKKLKVYKFTNKIKWKEINTSRKKTEIST